MKALDFLNCDQLCQRWGMDSNQLRQVIHEADLPFYDTRGGGGFEPTLIEGKEARKKVFYSLSRPSPGPAEIEAKRPEFRRMHLALAKSYAVKKFLVFKVADILGLEEAEPGLLKDITGQDARELGRLKREAGKMDTALKAAVLAGLAAAKGHLKKSDLWAALEAAGVDITEATFRKIWKMIPEKHRKRAGRPKKNMIK